MDSYFNDIQLKICWTISTYFYYWISNQSRLVSICTMKTSQFSPFPDCHLIRTFCEQTRCATATVTTCNQWLLILVILSQDRKLHFHGFSFEVMIHKNRQLCITVLTDPLELEFKRTWSTKLRENSVDWKDRNFRRDSSTFANWE